MGRRQPVLLIPIAVLPAWVAPVSWIFAPTWGMNALRESALGTGSPWGDVGMCVLLSVLYGVLGAGLLRYFLRSARRRGTLSLT